MKCLCFAVLIFSMCLWAPMSQIPAGIWEETFRAPPLDSWTKREHQRERVTWQVKEGELVVETQPFCNGRLNLQERLPHETHYTLEFTAFPIRAAELQVKMRILKKRNANVGIFVGRQPGSVFVNQLGFTYQFVDHLIGGPLEVPLQNPHIELALKEIELRFDRGRFDLYTAGEKVVGFVDANFRSLTLVGIVVFPQGCNEVASVSVDDFLISGPSIPPSEGLGVSPANKGAVVWGALKHR